MIKILQTSNIDLGATPLFTNEFSDCHVRHRLETFNAMVDLAIEHQVDLFMVLGHLFSSVTSCDEWTDTVLSAFHRLEEHGIAVVLYLTNQDKYPDNIDLQHYCVESNRCDPVELEIGESRLFLHLIQQPITGRLPLTCVENDELANNYHLGIFLKSVSDDECSNPYYDYLIHNKEFLEGLGCCYIAVGNRYPAKLVVDDVIVACSVGSPQALDFTQKGPCHCAIVTIDGQHNHVELVEIQRSLFERVTLDITECGDERSVYTEIAQLAKENLVLQVELVGAIEYPLSLHRILDQCQNLFTYLEIIDHTSLLNSRYLQSMAKENTVRGKLAQSFIVLNENNSDVDQLRIYELALRDLLQRFNAINVSNSKANL